MYNQEQITDFVCAFELGFMACEKGNNIQKAKSDFITKLHKPEAKLSDNNDFKKVCPRCGSELIEGKLHWYCIMGECLYTKDKPSKNQ